MKKAASPRRARAKPAIVEELALLKQIATDLGYRFELHDGVERVYRPDGSLATTDRAAQDAFERSLTMPADVTQGADGVCVRAGLCVCEDCWETIPHYLDFPRGLTSPESDGDAHGNGAKTKRMAIPDSDKAGIARFAKVVCLPCYLAAFARVYPGADPPALRADAVETVRPYEPHTSSVVYVDQPKSGRRSGELVR